MPDFTARPDSVSIPWVDSPFFPTLLQQAELDSREREMVRSYPENGYLIFDPEIPTTTLDAVVRDVRDRYQPGSDGYYSDERRIQDAWTFSENVQKIATAPRVLEVLKLLYRRTPFPFQTLNFRVGSEQRTHSDIALFDSIPHGFMAGVWVALEDTDETNGPLQYFPRSHKLPRYNLYDLGVIASAQDHPFQLLTHYEDFVEELMESVKIPSDRLHLQKGEAMIWAANLYHGGAPIQDPSRTRFSQVTHYYFTGCLYYTPLMSDPGLGKMAPRVAFNAESGKVVPQYYHGRLVTNPGEWPPNLADEPAIDNPADFPLCMPRSTAATIKESWLRLREKIRETTK